jgi:hypothetical protein
VDAGAPHVGARSAVLLTGSHVSDIAGRFRIDE